MRKVITILFVSLIVLSGCGNKEIAMDTEPLRAEITETGDVYTNEAWDFVKFITNEQQAKQYLENTKRPTALRSLINDQLDDEELFVFADQVLTAQSWYKGYNANAAEDIFEDMIQAASLGDVDLDDVIEIAAQRITQTLHKPQ